MAAILDEYGVRAQTTVISTIRLNTTHNANTWYDVGIDRADMPGDGVYIIDVNADTFAAGASMYSSRAISEPFYWQKTVGSNSGVRTIITMSSAFMGHAPNTYINPNNMMEFGILHKHSGVNHELQIKFAATLTLNGASGRFVDIRVYRLH